MASRHHVVRVFAILFLAATANMVSHLGGLTLRNAVAHEVNGAVVDHGVLRFLGLVLAPTMVSTVRCLCRSFQSSSCWARKCVHHINDDSHTGTYSIVYERYDMSARSTSFCKQQRRRLFLRVSSQRSSVAIPGIGIGAGRRPEQCPRTDRRPRNSTYHVCIPTSSRVYSYKGRV